MIYHPRPFLNLRNLLLGPIIATAVVVADDFVAENNKPWLYYAGVLTGYAVGATGIPGATVTVWAVGETANFLVYGGADGTLIRIYMDGFERTLIDTHRENPEWFEVSVDGMTPGVLHRIDLVNVGPSTAPGATGIPWMALGAITLTGDTQYILEVGNMAVAEFTINAIDNVGDSTAYNFKAERASGWTVAQLQSYADALLLALDPIIGSQITGVEARLAMTPPGGLKSTPDLDSNNAIAASVQFRMSDGYKQSVRINGIDYSLMNADKSLAIGGVPWGAFEDLFTDGVDIDAETVKVVNLDNQTFDTLLKASWVPSKNA